MCPTGLESVIPSYYMNLVPAVSWACSGYFYTKRLNNSYCASKLENTFLYLLAVFYLNVSLEDFQHSRHFQRSPGIFQETILSNPTPVHEAVS